MRILRLSLTDWRNYRTGDIDFVPGANVLTGRNGQGKTNLVEAIGYLSTLSSHRVAGDAALIRSGADSAVIRAVVVADDREVLAEVLLNRSAPNRAQVNRRSVRPREITRNVSSVLFAPEDLALVRGEPSARRRFLDELLVQRTPRFAGVIADYERALKQRNGLLRSARAGGAFETLDIWDERLVATGSELLDARSGLAIELQPFAAEQYAVLAGEEQSLALEPLRSIDAAGGEGTTAERFTRALGAARRQELERGITLVGPHRDDLGISINGLPARSHASHGESWSTALALRLGSVELLRAALQDDPIVILDDVFAELDVRRRMRLAGQVSRYEQVLITAAVEDDLPAALAGRVTRIDAGEIVREVPA